MNEDDLSLILGATLTRLALIIGFTFAMAVSRYDQRKNYEEQEANAIGTRMPCAIMHGWGVPFFTTSSRVICFRLRQAYSLRNRSTRPSVEAGSTGPASVERVAS